MRVKDIFCDSFLTSDWVGAAPRQNFGWGPRDVRTGPGDRLPVYGPAGSGFSLNGRWLLVQSGRRGGVAQSVSNSFICLFIYYYYFYNYLFVY